jgi:hypothetical protein
MPVPSMAASAVVISPRITREVGDDPSISSWRKACRYAATVAPGGA